MKLNEVLDKLSSNKELWTRVQSELSSAGDRRARFLALTKEQGLSVDPKELDGIIAAAAAHAGRELTEKDLELVSGGLNFADSSLLDQKYDSTQKVLIGLFLPAVNTTVKV